ncbi:Basement membrane-specific heparan sulfate proteoglycan core protein [Saguinus oedipus]|uniref:Basement membrane-specific heparan sulfate proteoglycan core protein n=1 Tax=Saguinus oedipus TaxID=9490 RepID=A0ABQ9V9T7_SAGOE|nr:Basement membrane-specific heparan sulfate proteoglycan core protein [Saguinus oedipus]
MGEFVGKGLTQFHCREGRRGSIQVDGEELVSGQSPGPNVAVNAKGSVYIGKSGASPQSKGRYGTPWDWSSPGLPCLLGCRSTQPLSSHLPAGGAPEVATLTRGRFSSGITGCVKNVVLHSARPSAPPPQPLDLQHRAQAGANTRPCPS